MAKSKSLTNKYLQGVGTTELLAGAGGLLLADMVPGWIIKTTDTTGKKLAKVGVALIVTAAAGMVAKSVSPTAGKAAVIGGVAGTALMAANSLTSLRLSGPRALSAGGVTRLGATSVSPMMSNEPDILTSVT